MEPQKLMYKILFAASDPADLPRLKTGVEGRDVRATLRGAEYRDYFELHERQSLRPRDFAQALLDIEPNILHFAGHGAEDGNLYFQDDAGKNQIITPDAIALFFEMRVGQIDVVLMNACYAAKQAKVIRKYVPYIIGMAKPISDPAAIDFAVGFYQALGACKSVPMAFKHACGLVAMTNYDEKFTPKLLQNAKLQTRKVCGDSET